MPTDTGIDDANRFVAQKHQDRILNALCRFSLSISNSGCQKLEDLPGVLICQGWWDWWELDRADKMRGHKAVESAISTLSQKQKQIFCSDLLYQGPRSGFTEWVG
jgi:hypothetical protein